LILLPPQAMGIPGWVLDPYIIVNSLAILSYLVVRANFDEDSQIFKLDPFGFTREMQVFGMVVLSLYVKYRKSNSVAEFFPAFFLHLKTSILICTFIQSGTIAAWYALVFAVLFFVLQQKEDTSPNMVFPLNTGNFGDVENDTDGIWVVQFYTLWAKNCIPFSVTFNDLSNRYTTKNLKFGKVDVGRFQTLAMRYNISLKLIGNNELPTLILFEKVYAASSL